MGFFFVSILVHLLFLTRIAFSTVYDSACYAQRKGIQANIDSSVFEFRTWIDYNNSLRINITYEGDHRDSHVFINFTYNETNFIRNIQGEGKEFLDIKVNTGWQTFNLTFKDNLILIDSTGNQWLNINFAKKKNMNVVIENGLLMYHCSKDIVIWRVEGSDTLEIPLQPQQGGLSQELMFYSKSCFQPTLTINGIALTLGWRSDMNDLVFNQVEDDCLPAYMEHTLLMKLLPHNDGMMLMVTEKSSGRELSTKFLEQSPSSMVLSTDKYLGFTLTQKELKNQEGTTAMLMTLTGDSIDDNNEFWVVSGLLLAAGILVLVSLILLRLKAMKASKRTKSPVDNNSFESEYQYEEMDEEVAARTMDISQVSTRHPIRKNNELLSLLERQTDYTMDDEGYELAKKRQYYNL